MINRISGELISLKPPAVVVEAFGVGYEIDLPMSDCCDLPDVGNKIIIHTHLVVREDAHLLFGFLKEQSRDCFRQLIKVSGIGPKIALALLSTLNANEVSFAINSADVATLCRTPGIGKKVAERILLELKGKTLDGGIPSVSLSIGTSYSIHLDIANALSSLGYGEKETSLVIKQLPKDIVDLSSGIKEALKLLSKHNSL
ncbi:MAG: Holliday junction branch migration protein RuvA [Neisseriaceae bacterium]